MKLIGIIFLMLFWAPVHLEENSLPLNKEGKVAFEGDVFIEGLEKEVLFRNAMQYAVKVTPVSDRAAKVVANMSEGSVVKDGSFLVYKKGLFTPQIHGEIKYKVSINVVDEGFSYSYHDFIFQYYEKNRYGQYAPVSGKKKALEEERFAGSQDLWEQHKKITQQHIAQHIKVLKAHMRIVPPGARLNDEEHAEGLN